MIEMRGELKNEIKELKEKLSKRRRNHALFHIPTYILILGLLPWLFYYLSGFTLFDVGYILMALFFFVILPLSAYALIVLIVFIIKLNVLKGTIKQKEKEYKNFQ